MKSAKKGEKKWKKNETIERRKKWKEGKEKRREQ